MGSSGLVTAQVSCRSQIGHPGSLNLHFACLQIMLLVGWMAAARKALAEARSNAISLCSMPVAGVLEHLGSQRVTQFWHWLKALAT